jgi:hypothetical protein
MAYLITRSVEGGRKGELMHSRTHRPTAALLIAVWP